MRIITTGRLREFWSSRKSDTAIAERDLRAWRTLARRAEWANFGSLKQTFGSADKVGDCVVFDVGNNRFRLIGRVRYASRSHEVRKKSGKIYVLKVMDHAEYDKRTWVKECGCHEPPPRKTAAVKARPLKLPVHAPKKGR